MTVWGGTASEIIIIIILLDQHPHFVANFKEDKNDKTKFLYTAC